MTQRTTRHAAVAFVLGALMLGILGCCAQPAFAETGTLQASIAVPEGSVWLRGHGESAFIVEFTDSASGACRRCIAALSSESPYRATGSLQAGDAATYSSAHVLSHPVRYTARETAPVSSGTAAFDGSVTTLSGASMCVSLATHITMPDPPTEYTIHFDANGGTGAMADQTVQAGVQTPLRPNAFTRLNGYKFKGWALAPNGTIALADKQAVCDLALPGETVTLYACWAKTANLKAGPSLYKLIPDEALHVVFTDEPVPEGIATTDVSYEDNKSVLGWFDETTKTFYITSFQPGQTIRAAKNSGQMFYQKSALRTVDTWNLDLSPATNLGSMFIGCESLEFVDVSAWDVSHVTNTTLMFCSCTSLTSLDTSRWNTSSFLKTEGMFKTCTALASLDVSHWDMSHVTSPKTMFENCSALASIDTSGWTLESATTLRNIFFGCSALKLIDSSGWNTGNVTDMYCSFSGCSSLETLDVSNWDVSKVTNMGSAFIGCWNLKALDVSHWNTSSLTNLNSFASECRSLTLVDMGSWDTSLCTNFTNALSGCSSVETLILGEGFSYALVSATPRKQMSFPTVLYNGTTLYMSNSTIPEGPAIYTSTPTQVSSASRAAQTTRQTLGLASAEGANVGRSLEASTTDSHDETSTASLSDHMLQAENALAQDASEGSAIAKEPGQGSGETEQSNDPSASPDGDSDGSAANRTASAAIVAGDGLDQNGALP